MRLFTAKQLHENPSEVYRAANREPIVITHRYHGEMVLMPAAQLSLAMEGVDTERGFSGTLNADEAIGHLVEWADSVSQKETGAPE